MKASVIVAAAIIALMVSGVAGAAFAHTGFLATAGDSYSTNSTSSSHRQRGEDDKVTGIRHWRRTRTGTTAKPQTVSTKTTANRQTLSMKVV
jgi:hypothetical protein